MLGVKNRVESCAYNFGLLRYKTVGLFRPFLFVRLGWVNVFW